MIKNKDDRMVIVFFILGIILGIYIIQIYSRIDFSKYINDYKVNSYEDILNNCKNLDYEKTSKCLVDNVKTFFKYTKTNYSEFNVSELKLNGGDCKQYSYLYANLSKDLGFYGYTFRIDTNETSGHRIAILSAEKGYCVLDQKKYECFKLK